MIDIDRMCKITETVIEEMGKFPAGWTAPGVWGRVSSSWRYPEPNLVMVGQRILEEGTHDLWRVIKRLDLDLCDQERYVESMAQNAYLSLMDYTSCGCRSAGIKWHPDEDGAMTIPEFLTTRFSRHADPATSPLTGTEGER